MKIYYRTSEGHNYQARVENGELSVLLPILARPGYEIVELGKACEYDRGISSRGYWVFFGF